MAKKKTHSSSSTGKKKTTSPSRPVAGGATGRASAGSPAKTGSPKSAGGKKKTTSRKTVKQQPAGSGTKRGSTSQTADSSQPISAAPASKTGGNGQAHVLSAEERRTVKTGLKKKDLQEFRQLLLEKRAEIIGDVESLQVDAKSDNHISYEHMADVGSDSYEQEFKLGLAESERKILQEIDQALQRIEEGTFGVCLESGQPIPRPRLEIKPWASYTIEVAQERERRGLED